MTTENSLTPDTCPLPLPPGDKILLAHGGGGRLMNELLQGLVLPKLGVSKGAPLHDSAVIPFGTGRLAFTTDSYVVSPLFFPGGDIGSLAVNGTVNDLAMSGARPLHLTCSLIIEEGFPRRDLEQVLDSMHRSAAAAGVTFVTGDTKVVERGKGDGLYVNTAGIGLVSHPSAIHASAVQRGDAIIVSGDLGRHAIAVMSARASIDLEGAVTSDCAPLHGIVLDLLESGVDVHCLRDLTRGGLASGLLEIAEACGMRFRIKEGDIKVDSAVAGACELLGFDPLYLANEGRFVAFVPCEQAVETVAIMRRHLSGSQASIIGFVEEVKAGVPVRIESRLGTTRPLLMLSGEQLPRIC